MTLFKTDRPRPIDRAIDYFGETRRTATTFSRVDMAPARHTGAAR